MSTHKHIDRICAAALALALAVLVLFVNGRALGLQPASRILGYETRLFDDSRVHTLAIVMDDWEEFLEGCQDEAYAACDLVIDNEAFSNVGLRAKGNTSLSMVSTMNSSRYSFKIEFDHYDSGTSYHGLDKLCLNNLIQDNTCMKDYLTYQMMAEFGAAAPLCSFVYVTVNGEDWGLYLAVEAMEESFLQRNYGREYGELYKPDTMDFGGGRGNGRDFRMEDVFPDSGEDGQQAVKALRQPSGDEEAAPRPEAFGEFSAPPEMAEGREFGGFPGGGGMGSDEVKLKYIDDDPASYSGIFDSAKTEISDADQTRLIEALRRLGEGDAEGSLDMDQVLRYFAVHNYVVNGDSYTGSMIHNYYLYEKDGRLAMLPWDYNLAFGGFSQGQSGASSAVNDPIDTPLSVTGSGDRPMADWIFQSGEYTERYHQYLREFLSTVDPQAIIDQAYGLIAPYVERDPTKFCTYEEFEAGVEALRQFCALRSESVLGQLAGTIPSTSQGQREDSAALVDASGLSLADMGSMNTGGGFGGRGGFASAPGGVSAAPGESMDGGENPAFQRQEGFRPGGMGNAPSGGPGGFPGGGMGENPQPEDNAAAWPLLALSAAVLAGGLLFAAKYKRR